MGRCDDALGDHSDVSVSPRHGRSTSPVDDRRTTCDDATLVELALAQSPLLLAVYDTQLRIRRMDSAVRRLLALGDGDLRGQRLADLLPGNPTVEGITQQLRRVMETGESERHENVARAPGDSRERAWAASISPIKDAAGRVQGILTAGFDISEQYRARERLALLNEASSRIGSTLDVTRTAQELAELAVPDYSDWVSVDLLDSVYHGGDPTPGQPTGPVALRRVAHQAAVAGRPAVVVELGQVETYPQFSPPARCLVTGRPILHRPTDPEMARWVADNPLRAAAAYDHEFHSVMFVPLRARGSILGVAVFARHAHLDPFTQDDLLLAEELGARAAVAIDNARHYTREHAVALTLQRSLLPQRLPVQAAVDVASRYRPAGSELGVGGDWFDVIPLSGARVALVVGDVVGHGVHAAATMGRLRTAVRTLADGELPPEELLTRLDDVVTRLAVEEGLAADATTEDIDATSDIGATCLYAVYDPVSRRCSLARAGHPPPALVTPDGTVTFLDVPAGPPLGLGGLPFEAIELTLPVGSLLVLYTDGLVESRDRDIDDGLHDLCRLLATPAPSLDAACDTVLDGLLPSHPNDDAALLIARTHGLDDSQVVSWELPAEPAVVARSRAQTGDQLAAWGLDELAFTTELVVSELVTNAIRHGRGPIELRLIRTSTLTCEVSDASGGAPHLRRAHAFDEDGRGLLLVAQLTKRWGSRHTADGKTIWAEQSLPPTHPMRDR